MKFKIGDKAITEKKFTAEEVKIFSELTGDINPIHLDAKYASTTFFKKPIVHGILCSGLISAVIANKLPGMGSIYLKQELKFLSPVYYDDLLTAIVEVTDILEDKKHYILKTQVVNSEGKIVIDGEARIKNDY